MVARTFIAILAAAAITGAGPAARAQTPSQVLTVVSFGGKLDQAYKKATANFEKQFGATIRWVPGTSTENAARISATRSNGEYDVAILDSLTYGGPQRLGAFAKLDPAIVKNLADVGAAAKYPDESAVAIGFNLTGLFYNTKVFQERGWAAPTSWDDLFRPEFCNNVGILHPNVAHGTTLLVLLAGGDIEKVPDGIARLSKLKGCLRTLEPSSPKMEEKIQLGEYAIGVYGSVSVVTLAKNGNPVRFVAPKEGTVQTATTCSVVKGGNEKLAQEFCNALLDPSAQAILRDESLYVPSSGKVDIPDDLLRLGLPTAEMVKSAISLDSAKVAERRRDWARRVEREMFP